MSPWQRAARMRISGEEAMDIGLRFASIAARISCCTPICFAVPLHDKRLWARLSNSTQLSACTLRRRISKLYIPGACANTRSNNLDFKSLSPKNFNCDRVENFSEDTCNKVMDQGTAVAYFIPSTCTPLCCHSSLHRLHAIQMTLLCQIDMICC